MLTWLKKGLNSLLSAVFYRSFDVKQTLTKYAEQFSTIRNYYVISVSYEFKYIELLIYY